MRTSRRLSLVAVPVHSFHLCLILALIGSWSSLFGSSGSITFTWKTIGDPGNPGMPTRPHGQMSNVITIGQVNHEYAMAKHEVTAGQYAHFLNCKARFGDPHGLYNPRASSSSFGYITRIGSGISSNPYQYAAKSGFAKLPVNFVGFRDALRFVNWLANGQGNGDTESGSYDLSQTAPNRQNGAQVFLPNEHEWQKAAYYDPRSTSQGGPRNDSHYWIYPQQSDEQPIRASLDSSRIITNPQPHLSNYGRDNTQGHCQVDSGGSGTESYYGIMHMGGNVVEWLEDRNSTLDSTHQDIRGGDWANGDYDQRNHFINFAAPTHESTDNGFRLAASLNLPVQPQ